MSTLSVALSVGGTMTGQSDPVSIKISDLLIPVDNPSITSGIETTVAATPFIMFPKTGIGASTNYVYVRNTGTDGNMTGTGVVILQIAPSATHDVLSLKVGDIFFGPVMAANGVTIRYDTAITNFTYAYFKRG